MIVASLCMWGLCKHNSTEVWLDVCQNHYQVETDPPLRGADKKLTTYEGLKHD